MQSEVEEKMKEGEKGNREKKEEERRIRKKGKL